MVPQEDGRARRQGGGQHERFRPYDAPMTLAHDVRNGGEPPTARRAPFVSYAQNFEDVILWRALHDAGSGFYIDVGAHSPFVDSVTRAFYERGWRGINLEPNADLFAQYAEARPGDVSLNLAVGERPGRLEMAIVGATGLSTLDEAEARRLADRGVAIERQAVDVVTLDRVWQDHVPAGQAVHFLKVDVEGYEREVVAGNAWREHRPWIVVVEATRPGTREPAHATWEPLLLEAGYRHVYADGLNRFYLAAEHDALAGAFLHPPNVFDGFIRASEVRAVQRAARAEAELRAIRGSVLWRTAGPFRSVVRRVRGLLRHSREP
jgi:FkbM family methyltransferase